MKKIFLVIITVMICLTSQAEIFQQEVSPRGAIQTILNLHQQAGIPGGVKVATATSIELGLYLPNEIDESPILLKGSKIRLYKGLYTLKTDEHVVLLNDEDKDIDFIKFFDADKVAPRLPIQPRPGQEVSGKPFFAQSKKATQALAPITLSAEEQVVFLFDYLENYDDIELLNEQKQTLALLEKDNSFLEMNMYFAQELNQELDSCIFKKGCHQKTYTIQKMVDKFYTNDTEPVLEALGTKGNINKQGYQKDPVHTYGALEEKKTKNRQNPP